VPTNYLNGYTLDGSTRREYETPESALNVFPNGIVIGSDSTDGIKLDEVAPAYGWKDIVGHIQSDTTASANKPDFNVYLNGISQYQFTGDSDEVFVNFHIPHDYVPGTHLYLHVHWSQNVVDTGGPAAAPGDVKWQFEVTYAKGHQQMSFVTPITTFVVQTASGVLRQHMVAEVQISDVTPSASMLASADIEVDGIILARIFRLSGDVADTLNQAPFLHFADIHYQSTGLPTKNKAPNFYA
jgi:hypothetical protein